MAEVKKITSGEGCKAPFRLFGNINHTKRTYIMGEFSAVFSVRPLRADERARLRASEDRLQDSHDWAGARERAGVTPEMLNAASVAKELGLAVDNICVERLIRQRLLLVSSHKTVDPDEYARFAVATREAVVACCESVTVGDEVTPFTADVWEAIPESVQLWLFAEVERDSTLTEDEEVGL
jgi:hypothetical protein